MAKGKRRNVDGQKSKTSLVELQQVWYAKLAESGFNDLENFNVAKGEFDDQFRIKSQGNLKAMLVRQEHNFHFFSLLRNFITHTNWKNGSRLERFVVRQYTEGATIPKIVKEVIRRRFKSKNKINFWSINKIVKAFVEEARVWNRVDPRGLEFEPTFNELKHAKVKRNL